MAAGSEDVSPLHAHLHEAMQITLWLCKPPRASLGCNAQKRRGSWLVSPGVVLLSSHVGTETIRFRTLNGRVLMQELEYLHLDSNYLTGTLPSEWGNATRWSNLTSLSIFDNVLSGTFPSSWGAKSSFPKLQEM